MLIWTWTWRLKGAPLVVSILCWVFFVHLAGMYLFTQGFLLSRVALPDSSSCSDNSCMLPATHQRLVLLVIDALRFDFVSPDPPTPVSPFHHNILTLPRELTARVPAHSFLYNAFADPPTTTVQRIRGITIGSLPSFVDTGSSFGPSSTQEDSLISQLNKADKRVAFIGDNTWMMIFPTLFSQNMTYPCEPLNIEDMDSGDDSIIQHLLPLLGDKSGSWDAIVTHFLGVDHVGHRVGPDHPSMKTKLRQMDDVLRRVVDLLEDDTLLVVLGDHGMDRKGDHGGDDTLETSSAMWIYSKGVPLQDINHVESMPSELLTKEIYPDATVAHRSIQQIDIVPTVSLLLGLPIPFNNLGTVIPELFTRASIGYVSVLEAAVKQNARQINQYVGAYRQSSSGSELDILWPSLEAAWQSTYMANSGHSISAYSAYTRSTLEACRSVWAQFNLLRMYIGLTMLGLSVVTASVFYNRLSSITDWEMWSSKQISRIIRSIGLCIVVCPILYLPLGQVLQGVTLAEVLLMSTAFASCATFLLDAAPTFGLPPFTSIPYMLILHVLCFFSNLFTIWEDRVIPSLLIISLAPVVRTGLSSQHPLRRRIILFSGLYVLCVRLIAISTICREQQQPYCHVTFYASSTSSTSPPVMLVLSPLVSLILPTVIRYFLAISASDKGIVSNFLAYILRPALLAGSAFWILEWVDTMQVLEEDWTPLIRTARTIIGCEVRVFKTLDVGPNAVMVINPNSYGLSFLLFWSIFFAMVYLTSQLTGQVVLALSVVALLAYLEVADGIRSAHAHTPPISAKSPIDLDAEKTTQIFFTFNQLVALAQLGMHAFYATGHQANVSSMQWKTAFVLTSVVSPLPAYVTIGLNTFGPPAVFAFAAPLLACWKLRPTSGSASCPAAMVGSIRAAVGMMLCYAIILLGSATSATLLREHAMVWKMFAPRFIAAAVDLVFVGIAVIIAVGVGMYKSSKQITRFHDSVEQKGKYKST